LYPYHHHSPIREPNITFGISVKNYTKTNIFIKNSPVLLPYGLTFERNAVRRRDTSEFLMKNISFSVVFHPDSKYTIYFALVLSYDDEMGTNFNYLIPYKTKSGQFYIESNQFWSQIYFTPISVPSQELELTHL